MRDRAVDEKLKSFCKSLPKVELHAHLNGSVSLKTIEKLAKLKEGLDPNYAGLSLLERKHLQPKDVLSMDSVFKLFPIVHALMTHREAVRLATLNVIEEFAEDGVVYLELRSTPKATKHMTKEEYIQTVINAIKEISQTNNQITTKLLLSIDRARGFSDAEETIDILERYVKMGERTIVGVDLSGNPKIDGRQYLPLLQRVRNMDLKVTLHLAELKEHVDELDELISFKPDRIGHGTFIYSHASSASVDFIIAQRIPFEICLSSNQLCATTKCIADSHLKDWKSVGNPVCISTDDKGLMAMDLSTEYFHAAKAFDFSKSDLIDCARNSLKAAFIDQNDAEFARFNEIMFAFEEKHKSL